MLNMPRPTFIKLLDDKHIPFRRSGNRRKVRYSDVLTYKQKINQNRLNALDKLSALDKDMDLGTNEIQVTLV